MRNISCRMMSTTALCTVRVLHYFYQLIGPLDAKLNMLGACQGLTMIEISAPFTFRSHCLYTHIDCVYSGVCMSYMYAQYLYSAQVRVLVLLLVDPPHCNGCGDRFTTEHAMSCPKGGLIIHQHNDLVTTWGQLCGQALTPSTVSDEPLIQPSRDIPLVGTTQTVPAPELRGDLAVHGFWTRGQTAIFDVRITDTDQPSNRNTNPSKVLLRHEKEKKDKYGALCIARQRTFTPLVFSVDGLLGKEATAASKRLASCLAAKWKRSYSELCAYVRSRLSLALIQSSSRCLRANRNPTLRFRTPMWNSGTGLGLYRM
jgi:hypothetical protein